MNVNCLKISGFCNLSDTDVATQNLAYFGGGQEQNCKVLFII